MFINRRRAARLAFSETGRLRTRLWPLRSSATNPIPRAIECWGECGWKSFPLKTILPTPEYDGTFVGALGQVWKEGEEWQTEAIAYIAGVYRDWRYKIMHGNVYDLDEEQVGTITIISTKSFLIGRITNMEGGKAPIVGFIIDFNEDKFVGRLMSFFGPAPHMWGQYIPTE